MMGGDNFTKMLGVLVHCFEDVNVGTRADNGVWSLNAKMTNVDEEKLFAFLDACRETDSHPAVMAGGIVVLGKN